MGLKRIFVAFAFEDIAIKRLFTGQAKNTMVPYEFVDMSIKTPFDEKWKTQCRKRILSCDGVIILISPNTKSAKGQLWEIKCAVEEQKPLQCIYIRKANIFDKPESLFWVDSKKWTWENVQKFIDSL